MTRPGLWVTETDYARLRRMLDDRARQGHEDAERDLLEASLDCAQVVPPERVPHDIVTMNSRVLFEDAHSGEPGTVTIVYPQEANPAAGCISVLSPVGGALIGAAEGEDVELPLPRGRTRCIRIRSVLYQPEAAGNFAL